MGKLLKSGRKKWLPNPTAFFVHSPRRGLHDDVVVAHIIDKNTRCWNVPIIKKVFGESETAEICWILISPFNGSDQQIWRYTRNGYFTVSSAYHFDKTLVAANMKILLC